MKNEVGKITFDFSKFDKPLIPKISTRKEQQVILDAKHSIKNQIILLLDRYVDDDKKRLYGRLSEVINSDYTRMMTLVLILINLKIGMVLPHFFEDKEEVVSVDMLKNVDWKITESEFDAALHCAVGDKLELFTEGYKGFAKYLYKKIYVNDE